MKTTLMIAAGLLLLLAATPVALADTPPSNCEGDYGPAGNGCLGAGVTVDDAICAHHYTPSAYGTQSGHLCVYP